MPDFSAPLAVKWNIEVGYPASCPVIANGNVYVTTRADNVYSLCAINGKSGQIIWGAVGVPMDYVAGIAYDGGRIYVAGVGSQHSIPCLLVCYDAATGNQLWQTACPGQWDYNSAPTAYAGYVYVQAAGIVSCVREIDGTVAWSTPQLPTSNGALSVSSAGIFVSGGCGNTYRLNPRGGASLWARNTDCQSTGGATSATYNGLVYVHDFSIGGPVNVIAALDAETGVVVKSFPEESLAAFDNGMKFAVAADGTLNSTLISTWTVLWSVLGTDNPAVTAPTCINGIAYVGTSTGRLIGYSEATGEQLLNLALPEIPSNVVDSSVDMAAGDGMLVIPAGNFLIAVARPFATVTVTTSPAKPDGTNGWFKRPVAVTVKTTAGTASYTLDGGPETTYSAPFTVSGDGYHVVTYWASDGTGQTATSQFITINIDTAPPTTTSAVSGTQLVTGTYSGSASVALSATDALSGVSQTTYSIDGGTAVKYTGPFAVTGAGNHTVAFQSTDYAGNTEPAVILPVAVGNPILSRFIAGLQLIGAPEDYSALSIESVFDQPMKLAYWDASAGRYAITPTSPADTIRPGLGYWIRVPTGGVDLLDVGVAVDRTKAFNVPLTQGWNMISDPFDVPVAVGALQAVTTGGLVYPVGAPGSVVGDTLYSFGPSSTAYSSVTGGSLQPFVGYWIYAFQNCTLTFPAMPGTPSPPPPLVRGAVAK